MIVIHKIILRGAILYVPKMVGGASWSLCFLCANTDRAIHAFTGREGAINYIRDNGIICGDIADEVVDVLSIEKFASGMPVSSIKEIQNLDEFRCMMVDYFVDAGLNWWTLDAEMHDDLYAVFVEAKLDGWSSCYDSVIAKINGRSFMGYFQKILKIFCDALVIDVSHCINSTSRA